jgi:GT2 family glycosyltransferase
MPRLKLLEIGGMDNLYNPMFCEDDDLIKRWELIGMNCFTALDSMCYHFVSKTSRFSNEYINRTQQIEHNSNRNFIRKWGFRKSIHNKTYDIGFRMKNCNLELFECDVVDSSELRANINLPAGHCVSTKYRCPRCFWVGVNNEP